MSTSAATLSSSWSHAVASAIRTLGPPAAVAGYTAGFSVLPGEWYHLGWLLLAGVVSVAFLDGPARWLRRPTTPAVPLLAAYLLWMTLRSCCSEAFVLADASREVMRGLFGASLLVMLCVLLWQVAQDTRALRMVGWITGLGATFAALISMGVWYLVLPGPMGGERLRNLLVHGGLNPVCTGLIFGICGLWLLTLAPAAEGALARRLVWASAMVLHLAAFFSGSRGAMLALVCGHVVLLLALGWRRGLPGAAVLAVTALVYFSSAPLMAKIVTWSADPAIVPPPPGITHHWEKAMERGDSGRGGIYRAGWKAVDNVWLGTGQWGVREVWQRDLRPDPHGMMGHLHSAFFATFVHGGIIGGVLLLALLGHAARCAWRLARQGDATWVALLAFGCGGLFFDGESLMSLATAPRFEGLLFWVPVIVALARSSRLTSPPADF